METCGRLINFGRYEFATRPFRCLPLRYLGIANIANTATFADLLTLFGI